MKLNLNWFPYEADFEMNFKFSFKFKLNMKKKLTFEMSIVYKNSLALMDHHRRLVLYISYIILSKLTTY